jgi:hypothetical protein
VAENKDNDRKIATERSCNRGFNILKLYFKVDAEVVGVGCGCHM